MISPLKRNRVLFFSFFVLFVQIVIFCAPGWIIMKFNADTKSPSNATNFHGYNFKGLSLGIWYFVADVNKRETGSSSDRNFLEPKRVGFTILSDFPDHHLILGAYDDVWYSTNLGLLEYQIKTTIGLGFAVVGCICAIIYHLSKYHRRWCGIVTTTSLLISGLLFWVTTGKISLKLIKCMLHSPCSLKELDITFAVPWCLIFAGLSATSMCVSSMIYLLILIHDCYANERGHKRRGFQLVCGNGSPAHQEKLP